MKFIKPERSSHYHVCLDMFRLALFCPEVQSRPPGLSGQYEPILRQFQGAKSFLKEHAFSPSDSYHPGKDSLSNHRHISTDGCKLLTDRPTCLAGRYGLEGQSDVTS